MENIRNFIHRNNVLRVNGEWIYGKMQLVVGINNTQNNSFLVTPVNDGEVSLPQIGPELTFVASPLNVTSMSFNNILSQQRNYIENKLLESQDNGSGWTLHSISYVHLLLVLNPRNISSSGLRALVGGLNYDYELDMGDDGKGKKKKSTLILDGGSGDFDDDEMENEVNEYDVTDKFADDSIIEADDGGDVSFYLQQNSKRR